MNPALNLQSQIQANLQTYPFIDKFLGKPLAKRIQDDDPLLCTLVRRLAQGELNKQSLDRLEELMCLTDSFLDNPQSVFTNLSRHRRSEFDKKLRDIEAELCALKYFYSEEGFQSGHKLRAGTDSKTPDFLLCAGKNTHVLEVKNMHWAYSLYYLFNHLEAMSLADPGLYDRWLFLAEVAVPIEKERHDWPQVQQNLDKVLEKIESSIDKRLNSEIEHRDKALQLWARVKFLPNNRFKFTSHIFRPIQNLGDLSQDYVRPFLLKVEDRANYAWKQIEGFRQSGQQFNESHIFISVDPGPGLPSPLTVDFVAKTLCSQIERSWTWLPCETRLWVWFQGSCVAEYSRTRSP